MAKAKAKGGDGDGDAEPKKKKKPIVPIVVVVLGLLGAKMFLLKSPAQTPAMIDAAKKVAAQQLYNTCASANHKPTLSDVVSGSTPIAPTTTPAKGSGAATERGLPMQLIATHSEAAVAAPIVAGMSPVLELDSVTVNLRDGHYLKVGLALQLAPDVDPTVAKDTGLGAKALDMALAALAKHSMAELTPPTERDSIKDDLGFQTCQAYEAKVLTVYFTEFVMQ